LINIPQNKTNEVFLCDLLKKLLAKDPALRPKSVREVKQHPWFSAIDWSKICQKKYTAPFIPRNILRLKYIKENSRQPESELSYIYDTRYFSPKQTRKDTGQL
jgi:serine/threonine protein kinase